MSITDLLSSAKSGLNTYCKNCPWNPNNFKENIAFGVSCKKHGVDWSKPVQAVSMLIAQDPAGTTPSKTGNLCGFCNIQNPTDKSAQQGYAIWKAAVSLSESSQGATRYMNNHYWTNAIMHGVQIDESHETNLSYSIKYEAARTCCENILFEQINLLSPKIVIVTGKVASKSLFDLGLITISWDVFKNDFSRQVYVEQTTLPSGKNVTIYCTFHGSARAVNTQASKVYTEETKKLLSHKIELLHDPLVAQRFLRQYPGITPHEKGMRVLLLHWLDIGEDIRSANTKYGSSTNNGEK